MERDEAQVCFKVTFAWTVSWLEACQLHARMFDSSRKCPVGLLISLKRTLYPAIVAIGYTGE